jgi:hypothetical protein
MLLQLYMDMTPGMMPAVVEKLQESRSSLSSGSPAYMHMVQVAGSAGWPHLVLLITMRSSGERIVISITMRVRGLRWLSTDH